MPADTLKEFTVGISYAVDEGSIRRAEQGFDTTGVSVKQLQGVVQALTRELQGLVKALSETAGRPARQIDETGRQIKNTWESLRKGALQWGTTTSLVTGAFVKSMQEVAKQYTDLYYLSARSGVSVQALKAMDNASKELGGSAGDATGAIANLHDQFQKYPQTQAKFREMTAGYAEAVRANMGMDQEQWNRLDQGTKDYAEAVRALKGLPAAQREVWAREWFGWNYEQTQKAITQMEEWEKSTAHGLETMEKYGLTQKKQEEIAKEAVRVQGEWNRLWNDIGGIFTQAFGEFGPKLEKTLEFLDKIVVTIGEFNKKVPGAATVEIFAGIALSTWGIATAIEKITGFKILPSWLGGAKKGSDELKGKVGGIQDALRKVCDEKCAGLSEGLGEAGKKAEGLMDKLKKAGEAYKSVADVAAKSPSAGVLLGQGAATAQTIALTQEFLKKSEKMAPEEYARYTTGGRGELAEKFWGSLGMGQEKLARQQAERLSKSEDEGERQMGTTWLAQTEEQRRQAFADREAARKTKEDAEKEAEAKGEKKEPGKYGELVGGLVGGFAGRAAGATLGTAVFPGLGSAAGGLAGGVAGSALGAWLGKKTGFQEGGVVDANLHHGEMVLPKNISQGMQKLFKSGGQAETAEKAMNRVAGLATTVAAKLAPAAMSPVFAQANATYRLIQVLEKGIAEAREDPKGLENPERGSTLWNKYMGGTAWAETPGQQWLPGMIGDGKESKDADRRLSGWLGGIGGAPKVVLDNVEEFATQFVQALLRKQAAGATGEAAGGAGPGGAGGGAAAGAGAPATAGGAAGAAVGGAVGEALNRLTGGPGGEMRDQRLDLLEQTIYQLETSSGADVTTSAAGARGHMQMMPATFREFAKPGENIDDPEDNKRVARRYIEHLYDRFGGDMDKVLTAYNAGPGRVGKPVGDLPTETQNYLAKAHKLWGGRVPTEPMTAGPVSPGFGGMPGEVPKSGRIQQLQSGVRNQPISGRLQGQLDQAAQSTGLLVQVTSGGQPETGPNRTGSHRHDLGGSADLKLIDPQTGKALDMRNPADQARMAEFMKASVRAGATGVGAGMDYMGPNTMHIGGGDSAAWGAGGSSRNAPGWVREAHAEGTAERVAMARGQPAVPEFGSERPLPAIPEDIEARMLAEAKGPTLVPGGALGGVASAQMGGIIPNIMGGIMPLLAHAGEMVLPRELSQGLQRMIQGGDAIAGIERIGALGLGGGGVGGNRTNNVTFNQTNNTNIASAVTGGSQAGTISRFREAHERVYGDLVRNFRAVLA